MERWRALADELGLENCGEPSCDDGAVEAVMQKVHRVIAPPLVDTVQPWYPCPGPVDRLLDGRNFGTHPVDTVALTDEDGRDES